MKITCANCSGTGYVPSTSRFGGDGNYRCPTCRKTGEITLSLAQVREVLRKASETYVSTERVAE